jgi:hypothetical protein
MKLFEIVDQGDWHMQDIAARNTAVASTKGVWLVDRATGKKLAGSFKSEEDAARFKANRKDRIPADARIVAL